MKPKLEEYVKNTRKIYNLFKEIKNYKRSVFSMKQEINEIYEKYNKDNLLRLWVDIFKTYQLYKFSKYKILLKKFSQFYIFNKYPIVINQYIYILNNEEILSLYIMDLNFNIWLLYIDDILKIYKKIEYDRKKRRNR